MNHRTFCCRLALVLPLLADCGLSSEPSASTPGSAANPPPAAPESTANPEFDRYLALCQPLVRALMKLDGVAKPDTDPAAYRQEVKSAYDESVKLDQALTKEQQQWAYHAVLNQALSAFRRAGDAMKSDEDFGLKEAGVRGLAEDFWFSARSSLRLAAHARETRMTLPDAAMFMGIEKKFVTGLERIMDDTDTVAVPQIRELEEGAKALRASANAHQKHIELRFKIALIKVRSDDPEKRRDAVGTLGTAALASDLGDIGAQILQALKKAADDPDPGVRARATEALKRFPAPKPVDSEKTIAAVREWGGTVEFDERRLEKPVIGVVFMDSKVPDLVMEQVVRFIGLRKLCFFNAPRISDSALAQIDNLPELTMLGLYNTNITDEGLKHVGKLRKLEVLDISLCHVTDSGLSYLKGLRGLKTLALNHILLTSKGLQHLEGMLDLTTLELADAALTDESMVHLRGLVKLKSLDLNAKHSRVRESQLGELLRLMAREAKGETLSDAETHRVEFLKRQEEDYKTAPRVGDDGVALLSSLVDLEQLRLAGTAVTDKSVELIRQFTKLRYVDLGETKVSDKGVQELKKALPELRVGR